MRQNSFGNSVEKHERRGWSFRTRAFELAVPAQFPLALRRKVDRFPYVPADPATRDERCMEVYNIQVQALLQRLAATGIKKLVIGISGGLDSTHALLVCAAGDGPARAAAHATSSAYTMPGFATSDAHARPGQAADGGRCAAARRRSTSGRAARRC